LGEVVICNKNVRISTGRKTFETADILAPIAYLQFSIGVNPFSRVFFFCNFVRNKIYVLRIEVLEPVVLISAMNLTIYW
jgi:hypothetical protein